MITMQSTTAQFGGFVFSTDNDQHPLITTAQRLLDVWVLVGVQMNILLMAAIPALEGASKLCYRLLDWMDLVEVGIVKSKKLVEVGLDGCACLWDTWVIMWQPLGRMT